jgi:hypothetical protein
MNPDPAILLGIYLAETLADVHKDYIQVFCSFLWLFRTTGNNPNAYQQPIKQPWCFPTMG